MKDSILAWLERFPQRWTYPLAGLVLALGAPIGFFILRTTLAGLVPAPELMDVEVRERLDAYVYMTVATAIAFMTAGRYVGGEKDRLRIAALTDTLTGLDNRRSLQDRAHHLLVSQRKLEAALLLVDLDGLKRINDSHGHAAGDRALCTVGDALRRVCRDADAFGRYGGDEFVVLLPDVRADEAMAVARRICGTMTEMSERAELGSLSVSIGVTDVERAGSNVLSGLVASADAALKLAKLRGKNRAELATAQSEVAK